MAAAARRSPSVAAAVAIVARARSRGSRLAGEHASDWLAAMPLPATVRQQARARLVERDRVTFLKARYHY